MHPIGLQVFILFVIVIILLMVNLVLAGSSTRHCWLLRLGRIGLLLLLLVGLRLPFLLLRRLFLIVILIFFLDSGWQRCCWNRILILALKNGACWSSWGRGRRWYLLIIVIFFLPSVVLLLAFIGFDKVLHPAFLVAE